MPLRGGLPAARVAGLEIAVMFMGSTLLTPLYLVYQREFGFSDVTLTLVYAAYAVGNLSALFLFGRLSDQIGRRRVGLPTLGLGGVATLVFLFATATPWLFVARIASGLAIGVAAAAATAWIAELIAGADKARASALATTANMLGIAVGPLLAGVLVQYAPAPLHATFVVYLVLLGLVAWRVAALPETVREPVVRWRDVSLRPRLGVPRDIRRRFVAPATAAFAAFALGGYYTALLPGLLAQGMGVASALAAGAILAEFYGVAAVAVMATRTLDSRTAMLAGAALMVPGVGGLLLAQTLGSIATLLVGTTIGGAALALVYRGSLQVVNAIAPENQRAEVVSSYMIACFLGNSLPVVGVGVLARLAGHAVAHGAFAAVIAGLAVVAFVTGWRYAPEGN